MLNNMDIIDICQQEDSKQSTIHMYNINPPFVQSIFKISILQLIN